MSNEPRRKEMSLLHQPPARPTQINGEQGEGRGQARRTLNTLGGVLLAGSADVVFFTGLHVMGGTRATRAVGGLPQRGPAR